MKNLSTTQGQASMDGDGVALTRYIGTHQWLQQDPFLLFDVFGSPQPKQHEGGFPPHPHRGFETLTYMLTGSMTHQDNHGHKDTVHAGGVQWMRAGSGIIHAETPAADNGHLWGTQLWINSPASKKMAPPEYLAKSVNDIPHLAISEGIDLHLIAGQHQGVQGALINDDIDLQYAHIKMGKEKNFNWQLRNDHQGFVYVITGMMRTQGQEQSAGQALSFKSVSSLQLEAREDSELLVVSGQPINEPIARRGPFVMNSQQELEQAFRDYRNGRF